MSVRARVVQAWQRLTRRQRQILRNKSIRSGDGVSRLRCKIIMALAQIIQTGSNGETSGSV